MPYHEKIESCVQCPLVRRAAASGEQGSARGRRRGGAGWVSSVGAVSPRSPRMCRNAFTAGLGSRVWPGLTGLSQHLPLLRPAAVDLFELAAAEHDERALDAVDDLGCVELDHHFHVGLAPREDRAKLTIAH